MTCLICRHFQPTEPQEHKALREAGQCESNCGKRWHFRPTVINYLRNHGGALQGWCRLNPESKSTPFNHFCGQISVFDWILNHWGVEPPDLSEDMFEWAQKSLTTVLRGTPETQERKRLEQEVEELRRQLKRSREISASRLKRLQKSKPEPKVEPEVEREPAPLLRLVAAE